MIGLPPYVIDGNLYDALAAPRLDGVVMHSFCVQADGAKLQAWLDKTFSQPTHGAVRYEVMGDRVFLGIAEIDRIYTEEPGGGSKGYTSEIDLAIWILARRVDDGLLAMRWIPAYLFVDSGPAMASGRGSGDSQNSWGGSISALSAKAAAPERSRPTAGWSARSGRTARRTGRRCSKCDPGRRRARAGCWGRSKAWPPMWSTGWRTTS